MYTEGMETFAAFERNLSEWLARAVEPSADPSPRKTELVLLRMFEERLKRLQTYLDKAERDAEQALAPLTNDIQVLRQWLDALSMARAQLVERTVRGV
ncbi:MAG TPA: hypothetical protein VMG10_01155 [Gemmataceae bacterium]|nr:hypothetical protein [Gemmataceae bacterium]